MEARKATYYKEVSGKTIPIEGRIITRWDGTEIFRPFVGNYFVTITKDNRDKFEESKRIVSESLKEFSNYKQIKS